MTLDRSDTVRRIEAAGLIAVIRADSARQAVEVCQALHAGGVLAWEIAMTTPGALHAIEQVADQLGDRGLVGVGTVLDAPTAVSAIHAGAAFVFCPALIPEVITATHRYGRAVVPGALTPTEVIQAWSLGADLVKIFPANQFGPAYFKDLRGPFPQVKLTPTGGVNLETVKDWVDAGAAALGVGSALVRKDLLRSRDWSGLTQLAEQFVDALHHARQAK